MTRHQGIGLQPGEPWPSPRPAEGRRRASRGRARPWPRGRRSGRGGSAAGSSPVPDRCRRPASGRRASSRPGRPWSSERSRGVRSLVAISRVAPWWEVGGARPADVIGGAGDRGRTPAAPGSAAATLVAAVGGVFRPPDTAGRQRAARGGHRRDDGAGAGAAAEVAGQGHADLPLGGLRVGQQEGLGRHGHYRRAEAALHGAVVDELLLQHVELAVAGKAFDREHTLVAHLRGDQQGRSTTRSSMSAVQAPHSPSPQPSFVRSDRARRARRR